MDKNTYIYILNFKNQLVDERFTFEMLLQKMQGKDDFLLFCNSMKFNQIKMCESMKYEKSLLFLKNIK